MSSKIPGGGGGDYEVGYGKPPVSTRFKKGASGNPKGRPKGARGVNALLSAAMNEKVTVTEGGRRQRVSKLEVAFRQLANRAASGDARATKTMLDLLRFGEAEASAKAPPAEAPEDRAARNTLIMSALRARHRPTER